jgi:hypothetical protein
MAARQGAAFISIPIFTHARNVPAHGSTLYASTITIELPRDNSGLRYEALHEHVSIRDGMGRHGGVSFCR